METLVPSSIADEMIAWRNGEIDRLTRALSVIAKALDEGKDGEFHTARAYLDEHDVFHDDLTGERVLLRVAQVALGTYDGK